MNRASERGAGTFSPASLRPSMWNSMASATSFPFQARLLQHTRERPRRDVNSHVTRYGHRTMLLGVAELPAATSHPHLPPTANVYTQRPDASNACTRSAAVGCSTASQLFHLPAASACILFQLSNGLLKSAAEFLDG